jgi:arylsulfatase A-like enzyme
VTRPRAISCLLLLAGLCACGGSESGTAQPPSFVLFVMDTLRADAVSAYGAVEGTTPALDRIAAGGLLYTRAYSHAPWTLPSHASLFTGLLPSQHGVDWAHTRAPARLVMLAERLSAAGWQTFGYSENPWVSRPFGTAQGFDDFRFRPMGKKTLAALDEAVTGWLGSRDPERPFFLFVNVLDAHWPYLSEGENPFLPAGTSAETASLLAAYRTACGQLSEPQLAALRGLYLANVRAADAKLARVFERVQRAGLGDETLWIVTSDHGEQLGEHGLFEHQFSLREPLIHVPLVVRGAPGAQPGTVIDTPVQHADVVPSVLAWAGLPSAAELPGRPLPVRPDAPAPARSLVAEYRDPATGPAREPRLAAGIRREVQALRADCPPGQPVHGAIRAVLEPPLKLIWYEKYPPQLIDLDQDPSEVQDLGALRPEAVRRLARALPTAAGAAGAEARGSEAPLDEQTLRELEELGYLRE